MELSYDELVIRVKELEKLDETHRLNSEKYSILFNQNTDAVVIIDPSNASLIEFNDQLCRQLGYTREELSKLKIPDIEAIETFEDTKKRIQSIMDNGSATFETKHRTKSGEIIDVLVIAQYLKLDNHNIYHCIWRDITESKKAEEEKNEGYYLLKNLADNVPGFIYQYRYHPDGRNYFPFATETIYQIYEVSPEEVKFDAAKVLSRLHPDDYESVVNKIVHSFETLEIWEDDYRVVLPERGERWVHGVAKPQKMDDGSVLWHGYISDITEKKMAEETIRKSEEKLKSYLNSSPIGIFVADSKGNFVDVNPAACQIAGYNEQDLLKMAIKDIINPIEMERAYEHFTTVQTKGFADGVFTGIKKNGENYWFSVVATKIDDNNLIGYSRDVTHIILSDRKLRESEAQLDNAMKLARMGNWVLDVESGIFTFNDNFYSIFDTDAEEMGGYTMSIQEYQDKFAHLEDKNAVKKEANFTLQENNPNYNRLSQATVKLPNGSIKNIAIRIFNEFDENGKIVRIYGVNQDITELKEAEKELQIAKEKAEESENQLKTLVKSMPDLVWLKDIDGRYLSCNHRFEELYGVKESELIGKTDYDFVDKETADFFVGNDRKVMETGLTNINEEFLTFASDGHEEYTETIKTPVYGKNKEIIGVLGIGRDITLRKEQEEEILKAKNIAEENERKLKAVNEIAKIGYWELDQETKIFTFTDNFYSIFKTSANEMGGYQVPLEFYANKFLHPADAHLVAEENRKALETNDPNYTSTLEHRIIFSDGSIGYMSVKIFVIKDENGETVKTYGVNQDITDRKIKEEEIKKLNEKYESFISNSTEAVYCLEFDKPIDLNLPIEEQVDNIYKYGYIGHCNLTIAKMYGLNSLDEFLNKRVVEIHGGSENPQNRDTFRQFLLNNCRTQDLETEEVGIEGQTIYFLNNDSGVVEDGKLLRIWGTARDITERKKAEQEIKAAKEIAEENERQMHKAQNTAKIGNWVWYIQENKLWWSDEMYNIFDVDKDTYTGDLTKVINEAIHPEDRALVEASNLSVINENKPIPVEYRVILKNGVEKYVLGLADEMILDENGRSKILTGIVKDITDYKVIQLELLKAKENAEESEKQLKAILDNTLYPITLTTTSGNLVFINNAALEYFEIDSAEKFMGETVIRFWKNQEHRNEFLSKLFKDGYVYDYQNSYITDNNNEKIVLVTSNLLDYKGEKVILAIYKDITERIKIEKELINAKEKAEESDRLKSAFLCNVSHEIRTPLNAIVGFSALLNDEDLTREDRESFNNIIKSRSNDLLNIINDILDLSQIEANQMKVNVTEGKVGDLVDEIYKTFNLKKRVENKEHIELKIAEVFDPKYDLIKTDFHRVKQIISNFLTNAFKFTKKGSIKIGSKLVNNEILFYVSDTGIGINQDDLPKIFERFRQIEYSDKRSYGGNGLGLSISKGLAELLGGRIWAESELNVGSTFYLSIPYDPVNQVNKSVISDTESKQSTIIRKILIVEDDQYNLFFLEKLVKSLGYDYISAKNGKIAIEEFRENLDIDLILLDIQLPDISGMDLLQIFKTERFEVPVIAQTAFAMEEDKVRILESGCDDYISKPIMRDILFKKIKQFLG